MKKIVEFKGEKREVTVMSFDIGSENWNVYHLNDGTTVRVKLNVLEILRLDGEFLDDGTPNYIIKTRNDVVINAPDHLRKVV